MDSVINNGSLGFSLHEAFIEEIEQALNYNENEDMNEPNSGCVLKLIVIIKHLRNDRTDPMKHGWNT